MNKEERRKKYKSMTSQERQELILKKMKAKGIEVGSGVPNRKYLIYSNKNLVTVVNTYIRFLLNSAYVFLAYKYC